MLLNKSECVFEARITKIQNIDFKETMNEEFTLLVKNRESSPSLMFKPVNCTLLIALRIFNRHCVWSNAVTIINDFINNQEEIFSSIIEGNTIIVN